ncbi:hypothetical protein I4U23_011270 [Adineta vaga]|nr:hypothetical protein I4U23_011270 [Adineta vaga]
MGSVFSDILGIGEASDALSKVLVYAEKDAAKMLRYVLLAALNYVKSFTPVVGLIMILLILLLLVATLFILNRVLIDLEVNLMVRRYTILGVSIFLYIWFLAVQIITAIKQKSVISIIVAVMACLGLAIIMVISIEFIRRSFKRNKWCSYSSNETLPTKGNAADHSRPRTDYTKLSDDGH